MNDMTQHLAEAATVQQLADALALQRKAYLAHPVPTLDERKADLRTLQRFVRDDLGDAIRTERPRVLIVAPLSGHFATLLNDTARTMLADGTDLSTVQKITRLSVEDIQGVSH